MKLEYDVSFLPLPHKWNHNGYIVVISA